MRDDITIRRATPDDFEWIRGLIPRLHAFGPPAWRRVEVMNAAEADATVAAAGADGDEREVLVAVGPAGARLGFVHLETAVDFFTRERHGHISTIVVSPDAEKQGVGRALIDAAQVWTRAHAYRFLTLNVFERNARARRLYEESGFLVETIKYSKIV